MAYVWQAIPEPDLVPCVTPTGLPMRPLLVLAPHPDDEVLGCGGTLALASAQGVDMRVVVESDGIQGGDAAAQGFSEIGQPSMPSLLVDIAPESPPKQQVLDGFPPQRASQRHGEHVLAPGRYGACTQGPPVSHAAAFRFPDRSGCGDVRGVRRGLQRLAARRLGVAP